MASSVLNNFDSFNLTEDDSDYGSDFSVGGEEILNRLLDEQERIELVEDNPIAIDPENHVQPEAVRVPRYIGRGRLDESLEGKPSDVGLPRTPIQLKHQNMSHATSRHVLLDNSYKPPSENEISDTRSPIEQFRTAPKKPLSVTDLVSPAWCELQYWYALKIRGRPKQTKAMQSGSEVHKELENQVYTTVQVEIATKEDGWGLRIWNVIQGLRTLQEIGFTRELEVWGVVDGLVVNGVIDEVSFSFPDREQEAQFEDKQPSGNDWLPTDQTTISDFFKASGNTSIQEALARKDDSAVKKLYISDVKTRSSSRLPVGAAFRPTKMQLMIYHYLLSNLVTNQVDFEILLDRYELDGDKPFSDSFIARIGSLNQAVPDLSNTSSQDSMTVLLEHNSLRQIWSYMIETYERLLPNGKNSISNILRAEYRSRDDGEVLGSNTIAMDDNALKVYLEHELKWWKGQREPLGVVIEEAYKCKICDYADICDWRKERVAEATEKARASKKAITEMKKWEV